MTHSSIGSGENTDSNENHPTDGLPSKTMGEETQASRAASSHATPAQQDRAEGADASRGSTPKSTKISESRFSSPFQQLLAILAQYPIWPKMPVKGLPRDPQLLA